MLASSAFSCNIHCNHPIGRRNRQYIYAYIRAVREACHIAVLLYLSRNLCVLRRRSYQSSIYLRRAGRVHRMSRSHLPLHSALSDDAKQTLTMHTMTASASPSCVHDKTVSNNRNCQPVSPSLDPIADLNHSCKIV